MNNFNVNYAIAKHEHPDCEIKYDSDSPIVVIIKPDGSTIPADYCNDWNITGPLIIKYKVKLEPPINSSHNYYARIGRIIPACHPNPCTATARMVAKHIARIRQC